VGDLKVHIVGVLAFVGVGLFSVVGATVAAFRLRKDRTWLRVTHRVAMVLSLAALVVTIFTGAGLLLLLLMVGGLTEGTPMGQLVSWLFTVSFVFMLAAPLILKMRRRESIPRSKPVGQ